MTFIALFVRAIKTVELAVRTKRSSGRLAIRTPSDFDGVGFEASFLFFFSFERSFRISFIFALVAIKSIGFCVGKKFHVTAFFWLVATFWMERANFEFRFLLKFPFIRFISIFSFPFILFRRMFKIWNRVFLIFGIIDPHDVGSIDGSRQFSIIGKYRFTSCGIDLLFDCQEAIGMIRILIVKREIRPIQLHGHVSQFGITIFLDFWRISGRQFHEYIRQSLLFFVKFRKLGSLLTIFVFELVVLFRPCVLGRNARGAIVHVNYIFADILYIDNFVGVCPIFDISCNMLWNLER